MAAKGGLEFGVFKLGTCTGWSRGEILGLSLRRLRHHLRLLTPKDEP